MMPGFQRTAMAITLTGAMLSASCALADERPQTALDVEHDGDTRIVTTTASLNENWYVSSSSKDRLLQDTDANRFAAEQELWLLNGGYQHNFSSQLSFFVEAGMAQTDITPTPDGYNLTSGVSYRFHPKMALRSRISHLATEEAQTSNLEVQGRFQLSTSLDLRASYDIDPQQQNLSFGVGFRF